MNTTVKITHTINICGWDLVHGMLMVVTKVYFRNGETQLIGFVDGRTKKEEVPAVWTDIKF